MHNILYVCAIYVSVDTESVGDRVQKLSQCMVASVTGKHMQWQERCVNTWLNGCGAIAANRDSNRYGFKALGCQAVAQFE